MTTKNTAQSLSVPVQLTVKRINLEEEIKVLEETLKSRDKNLPPANPETVKKFDIYEDFIQNKIDILEKRKKQLVASLGANYNDNIKHLDAPNLPQRPLPQVDRTTLTAPVSHDVLIKANLELLKSVNKKNKLDNDVRELKQLHPKVSLPKYEAGKIYTIEDQIDHLERQKTILETAAAAALATPPTPPTPPQRTHNLKEINADNYHAAATVVNTVTLTLTLPICGLQEGDKIQNIGGNQNINITLPKGDYKKGEKLVIACDFHKYD